MLTILGPCRCIRPCTFLTLFMIAWKQGKVTSSCPQSPHAIMRRTHMRVVCIPVSYFCARAHLWVGWCQTLTCVRTRTHSKAQGHRGMQLPDLDGDGSTVCLVGCHLRHAFDFLHTLQGLVLDLDSKITGKKVVQVRHRTEQCQRHDGVRVT